MSLFISKFDHEKFRELLIAAIIVHDLPFQFVEWVGIRATLHCLQEDLNLVTRNTCKANCFKLYRREMGRIHCHTLPLRKA